MFKRPRPLHVIPFPAGAEAVVHRWASAPARVGRSKESSHQRRLHRCLDCGRRVPTTALGAFVLGRGVGAPFGGVLCRDETCLLHLLDHRAITRRPPARAIVKGLVTGQARYTYYQPVQSGEMAQNLWAGVFDAARRQRATCILLARDLVDVLHLYQRAPTLQADAIRRRAARARKPRHRDRFCTLRKVGLFVDFAARGADERRALDRIEAAFVTRAGPGVRPCLHQAKTWPVDHFPVEDLPCSEATRGGCAR